MAPPNPDPGMPRSRYAVLQRNAWFTALDPALQQQMLGRAVPRRYAARRLVYTAGSQASGCYFVLSGEVRLEHLTRNGKFAFYQSTRAGGVFGLLSSIDGSPRFSDARAWVETTLLQLPHAQVLDLYQHHAAAREAFVALLCQQLHASLGMLVEEHSLPPRQQIASILVALLGGSAATGDGERSGSADPGKLTHEAIAAMAGVSRPTVAKVLHEFREMGLVSTQYGRVQLSDARSLKTIAEGSEARHHRPG
jgi:CRP/FNR family transcriptional regulator, cyclic AMP receptor protein